MKVAVCISGAIKFPHRSLGSLQRIYPNENLEIFIHTWDVSKSKIDDRQQDFNTGLRPYDINILSEYNPRKVLVEHYEDRRVDFQQLFENLQVNTDFIVDNFYRARKDLGIISMFYSIFKSNELKSQYEKENNFIFDKVIRMRFDSGFGNKNLILDENPNMQIPIGNDWGGINDQFAIGSSKDIDYYSNFFNELKCMCFKDEIYHPEIMLKKYLDKKYLEGSIQRIDFDVNINDIDVAYR
jgi:hypothetical protein